MKTLLLAALFYIPAPTQSTVPVIPVATPDVQQLDPATAISIGCDPATDTCTA